MSGRGWPASCRRKACRHDPAQIWWVPLTGIIWLLGLVGLPKSRVTLALFGRGIASYDREVDIYLSEKLPRPLYWCVLCDAAILVLHHFHPCYSIWSLEQLRSLAAARVYST